MARGLGGLLLSLIAAGGALVLGLAGATLRTGRLDPLDWLFPGISALAGLTLWAARGGQVISWGRLGAIWAVVALPPLLFIAWAGMRAPVAGMVLLAVSLALAAMGLRVGQRFNLAKRFAVASAMIVAALLIPRLVDDGLRDHAAPDAPRPVVAVLSALPLQGVPMGASQSLPAAESIGLRSPIWAALEKRIDLHALDALDEKALAGVDRILLAQPRALSPVEFVVLDAWVRRGGEAVILSDPLLQWTDPRPLAHPMRAPLTSLLDPLLTHWGLRLEPAEISVGEAPVQRRAMESRAMVQLAAASRFTKISNSGSCILSDEGLIATCRIGAGRARLMADADWINDAYWTLSPEQPHNQRAQTSDAVDMLVAWLRGEEVVTGRWVTWVASEGALIAGLRAGLILLLLLALGDWMLARRPSLAQRRHEINIDQIGNIDKTSRETG